METSPCCRKINDVYWLVKEAASRNGQSASMYWPLSRFYKGPANRSAKDRRKRYHELLLKVSKLPSLRRELFARRFSSGSHQPLGNIPLPKACLPPEYEIPRCLSISDVTNAPSSPRVEEVSAEAVASEPVGEEIPPTLPGRKAKKPSGFRRVSSRASGRLALMKIRQGIAAKDSPKGSFKERISALEGIEEDSASSADVSSVAYHEPVALAAPKIAPEFSPERHDSAPNLSPAVGVGSELALAIVLYVPPLATAQDTSTEPELPLDDATDISLGALALQASSAPVDTVAVASSLTVSDTALAETNVGPSATSTAIGIGLPSCSHEVDMSLWAALDDQVNFPAPPSESAGGVSFSDSMVKRQLSALSSIVTQGPCPSYEQLKPIVEKLTEVLVLLGCPLTEWAKKVTLLLKYVKRQQFLLNELPDQLVALELRLADQEAVLESIQASRECRRSALEKHDMNSQDLQAKIARLKAELGTTEDELARLELSRGRIEEALLLDEGRATSAEEAIKEIVSEKARLKEMASSPYLGILPLEDLFRDLQ
ncbi:hypothetical protein Taro_043578 [Colocasia esculenta]|uniref:Uncharacterized protein n=1 Tax=Colocasia esculenta TaxID=4460 RepID=A0A843WRR9_COLES|nr:hypothetical protein [Colocasia esculenta]